MSPQRGGTPTPYPAKYMLTGCAGQRGGLATHLYFNSKRAVVSRDERGGRASKYCATDGKEVGDRQQEGPCRYGRDQYRQDYRCRGLQQRRGSVTLSCCYICICHDYNDRETALLAYGIPNRNKAYDVADLRADVRNEETTSDGH